MVSTFKERFNDLMTEKNFTGEQIANTVGVSFPAVSQWKNEWSDVSVDNLLKLAKLFDCSIDFLVGRSNLDSSFLCRSESFISRLQELITTHGDSLYRLNKKGIMPKSTYYTWKKGATPRIANLIPIADYYKCTLDFLLGC